jgi:hormone-sensitive lipase
MGKKSSSKSVPRSPWLLFHVHGGGWAAQTSKSHEVYLRQWAAYIDCPILSVDYQLAPKAPFPRGLEDCYYAYCWALNNLAYLGTTGERIVFAGDSAGANLISALTVMCIENGVRIPDGLLNIYGIYHLDFLVSPSVCLSLTDPMLPFGMTSSLLKSYGMDTKADANGNFLSGADSFKFHDSHLLSPYKAPDAILRQFPPTCFLSAILDPLLDDNIEFGKKLRSVGVNVNVDVLNGLYHGFLYFIKVGHGGGGSV